MDTKRLSAKLEKALSAQMNVEDLQSHVYLSYGIWASDEGYEGIANFLFRHAQEERDHAIKFMQYVLNRGGKPKVEALPGDGPPSPGFREEHTLGRWVEAVAAATRAARRLPGIDTTRLLIVGHSEGGLVAARVAARLTGVTHVALLAGGGPTQLFDLLQLARAGTFFSDVSADPGEREAYVRVQWDSIRTDPESATRSFLGHPYRRWSTFLADSPIDALKEIAAKVFLAQGELDRAVTRESFEVLAAQLTAAGRAPTVHLVPGADHSFALTSASPPRDGWAEMLGAVLRWFLA